MVESKFKTGVVLLKSSFSKHLLEGRGSKNKGVSGIGSAPRPVVTGDEGVTSVMGVSGIGSAPRPVVTGDEGVTSVMGVSGIGSAPRPVAAGDEGVTGVVTRGASRRRVSGPQTS